MSSKSIKINDIKRQITGLREKSNSGRGLNDYECLLLRKLIIELQKISMEEVESNENKYALGLKSTQNIA